MKELPAEEPCITSFRLHLPGTFITLGHSRKYWEILVADEKKENVFELKIGCDRFGRDHNPLKHSYLRRHTITLNLETPDHIEFDKHQNIIRIMKGRRIINLHLDYRHSKNIVLSFSA